MSWGFETEPEYQAKLDWVAQFVKDEVEPLELVLGHPADVRNPRRAALVKPLQQEVRRQGMWACHLGPELGGQGYGQVKLAIAQ
jgi:acyl-CoA dehydrogenase